jgi:hypothetical protein
LSGQSGTGARLRFTKGRGKHDVLEIIQDGAATQRIDCPKQGIIPHDMVHYAVESTVMAQGFLRRVVAGEGGGYRMQSREESDGVERLVEVFQGDAWSGGASSPEDMLGMYRLTCAARECPPLPVDAPTILAVRETIQRLGIAWARVPVDEYLELSL